MTTAQCREILQKAFGKSVHSYRKGRAILRSIFACGMRQEWCDSNPVDRIDNPEVQEKVINPLNLEEVTKLQSTAALKRFRDMRFSLILLLYRGVRPAEVERLAPEDVCWEERQVIIRPGKRVGAWCRCGLCRGCGSRIAGWRAIGRTDGWLCAERPDLPAGCRMSAGIPLQRITLPIFAICRSCSWKWGIAMFLCCGVGICLQPYGISQRSSG